MMELEHKDSVGDLTLPRIFGGRSMADFLGAAKRLLLLLVV
jgi:hypothetical protein